MFDVPIRLPEPAVPAAPFEGCRAAAASGIEALVQDLPLPRKRLRARQHVFRAGQVRQFLYLVHAGFFKTCLVSEDGREKITGFRMRGDLLGIDSLDLARYSCDAIALEYGEVWEIPVAQLQAHLPGFQERLTAALANEIRRDWGWMLALGTLTAEQRVATFLLDFSAQLERLGFSASCLLLRMPRGDLANFLSLQLETVIRVLARLQGRGLIDVSKREIRIHDRAGLQALLSNIH